ncbi:L,D-transpeptidase [Aestuariibius sp. HNIBRBA575]|uniref:L,D-transpeptidase family protein n=1 Tax=Aestuariibius sp. HNIBRBA575 TaxID=3233343 RepID=UPI0034A4DD58
MSPYDMVVTPRGLRFMGQHYPCTIGRGGITDTKTEGDMATPRGTHYIVGMMYRPDRIIPPNDWATPILPGDLWSDDPKLPDYNHMVRAPYAGSAENLRMAEPLYDLMFVTDWNYPDATPNAGSAIFMHQWRRPGFPTAGCVALRRDHLFAVATQIKPGTALLVR